ncbi:MAG TPA: VWA domain-containing protein [Vicinamibacterales bacterium]
MFGLSFLSPWFLLGALAVAVPVVLHLRRREVAPPHAFGAVRFLRKAPFEQQRPRKLHDLLLLVLRAAALLLLALAFARPYIAGADTSARTLIVAVDTSFSMAGAGRMERAREAALHAMSAAGAGDKVAVVRFDDRAAVLAEPSLDRGAARAAIGALAPGHGGTDYGALFAAATRLAGHAGGRLVVISDLQRAAWTGSTAGTLPEGLELEVVDVGGTLENLSVGPVRREGDAIVAQVTNHGFKPRQTKVGLWLNDRSVAEAAASVEPGRTAAVTLMARLPSSGVVRVSIDDQEGVGADDERFLVLDPPPAPAVLLLGEADRGEDLFFLRSAIEAGEGVRRFTVEALSGPARNALRAETVRERQVVIVTGSRSINRETRQVLQDYVRSGGALWLIGGDTLDAGTLAEIIGTDGLRIETAEGASFPTSLAPVDRRHPIFAAFGEAAGGLGNAQFNRALRIVADQGGRVVARFTNGLPALVEYTVGQGRVAVFASDMAAEWNTFPRQPAFVAFVLETLHYLSDTRLNPTELLVADVPAGLAARPGVVTMGHPPRPVAVNVDLRESVVAKTSADALESAVRRIEPERRAAQAVAREREASQNLWWFVLAAVALFLLVESVAAGRRRRPTMVDA